MNSISVIIPTYNRAHLLPRCLNSVVSQELKPLEIIVVDDGSTDSTRDLVRRDYPGIRLIPQENRGVSAARNAGIGAARGEWLAFIDSDDSWLPGKLNRQMQTVSEARDINIVHTDEIWIRNGVRVNPHVKHRKYGGFIFKYCLPLCVISPSSVMIHRRVFDRVGLFDETLPVCEDYDLWLRICARMPVAFVCESLITKYGGHPDQLSTRYRGMDRFRIRSLDRILNEVELEPSDREAAIDTLVGKIRIYLNGARKHSNRVFVPECEQLLARYAH
ncbi:MAG: glycosyltransferase [Gammaproteobacteria bacterium]|nr:glycosyltransferase [Gammaproteobacteria bacterium]